MLNNIFTEEKKNNSRMERKWRKSKDKDFSFFIFRLHMEKDGESDRQRNGRVWPDGCR